MKDVELNGFQSLSVVGLIFSVVVQISLILIGKEVANVWLLYPSWGAVFIFGTILRYFSNGDDHHHH